MELIRNIETAILERLAACIPGVAVEQGGSDPSSYKPNHPKGALVVYFTGANFYTPLNYNDLTQKIAYQFAVSVYKKELHGNDGAYALLQQAQEALTGCTILKNKLAPLSVRLVNCRKGLWHYEAKFEICLPATAL